jgi:BASS family bile acid:Na+ symporter
MRTESLVIADATILLIAAAMLLSRKTKPFAYTMFIVWAVAVALSFPQYFLKIGSFELKRLIVPLLQIITFGVGCTMTWQDLAGVWKTPRSVLIGVACHYTIMPIVALTIAKLFGFPPEIAAGVVLVGCCPSGLASNVIAYLARANLALSVTITSVSTLMAPLFTPLLMKLLAREFVHVEAASMMMDILKIVIVPVLAGAVINQVMRRRAKWIAHVMPTISMLGVAAIIIVISAQGRDSLIHVGLALVAAMFLHMTAGFTLGYISAKLFALPERDCRTISIEVGMQNGGLASGIAVQMGKIATVGLAPAVNGPVMNTTFSLLGMWWSSRPTDMEGDAVTE